MSNRLYVGNLAFHTTENVIQEAFSACGDVVSVTIVLDRETGRSRGFAFVEMANLDSAQKAIAELDGHDLQGRALRVSVAEDRRPGGGGGRGGGGGGYGGGGGGGGYDDRGGSRRGGRRRGG